MKNRDVKRLLKTAYSEPAAERKAVFLRTCQPRKLHYWELLVFQLRYMGPQLIFFYSYAFIMLFGAVSHIDLNITRLFAAMMPALALLALTGLGKSVRCGMEEIEMATRFSRRMIKVLRLAIIGLAAGVTMLTVSCVLKAITGADFFRSLSLACLPYLTTTFFSMVLIRKWHSRKNIYGCVAIAFVVCLATFCGAEILASLSIEGLLFALTAAVFFTGCEFGKYLKESGALQWNLC